MYQNAGEKGRRHPDPADPPRRRALKFNGHGTFDNDRPPILGVIGRESGKVFLRQTYRSTLKAIEPVVLRVTAPGTEVHTDEWHAYDGLDDQNRLRFSVNHKRKEWARDDDGDGVREVHSNTIGGLLARAPQLPSPLPWRQQVVPRPLPRVLSGHAQLPA